MKKISIILTVLAVIAGISLAAVITSEISAVFLKLDTPVKKLYAAPKDGSKAVYELPISVRLVGMTPDKKWYKVRISYNFFGYFETEGWAKVE